VIARAFRTAVPPLGGPAMPVEEVLVGRAGAGPDAGVGPGAGAGVNASANANANANANASASANEVVLVPIIRVNEDAPMALLLAGVNPHRALDANYRDFLGQVSSQIGAAIGGAVARAEDRERERALAEQDVALRDLASARAEAERANGVKEEFLAMLGHELRNPLAPIVTALELMRGKGDPSTERERTIIDRQVKHLVRLVDDLLDVSRITRGKIALQREELDLADVVSAGIEIASPLLEERWHALQLDVPKGRYFVHGDRARLGQIVSHLVSNAAKYTEPSGRITIELREEGGELVLRVRDSGMGMPPHLVPRVFDLFEQGAQTIDRASGGLGLGLAIVKSIASLHDGSVTASSPGLGRGSEFVLRLPAMRAEQRAQTAEEAPPSSVPGSRRVLIVDDNQDGADLLDLALRSMGHTTRVAYDGPEALAAARDFHPEVALIDIGLPVMDGYEVAERLRAMFDGACPRLVAVTGYGQESDRQRAREAGFDRHLVKPVELSRLSELLLPGDPSARAPASASKILASR
jgi:signal transduction histidine kinase/CheY-like chemotaxis protein